MKIIYIKIKNYKSIRELEINDIENALILVGKNNTGKTSVIDALLLASDLKPAPAHEFLDITKPIDISIQIIYGRGFKLLLFKRNTMQIKQL